MSLEQVAAAVSIVFQGAANPNNTQQTQGESEGQSKRQQKTAKDK